MNVDKPRIKKNYVCINDQLMGKIAGGFTVVFLIIILIL